MSQKSAKRARRVYGFRIRAAGASSQGSRAERRRRVRAEFKRLTTVQPASAGRDLFWEKLHRQVKEASHPVAS